MTKSGQMPRFFYKTFEGFLIVNNSFYKTFEELPLTKD